MTFNQSKTAQMAAWILSKCGSPLNIMKLMKLLYLADRTAFAKYGQSLTGDRMVSMPYGPVLSSTLNIMNGEGPKERFGWDYWISDRSGHMLALRRPKVDRDDLDELSDVDLQVLDEVCASFGHMDQWQLSDYTHDRRNCPEWQDPCGSSLPIRYEALFKALGRGEIAAELSAVAREEDKLDALFARL